MTTRNLIASQKIELDTPEADPANSVAGLCDHTPWRAKSVLRHVYMPFGALLLLLRCASIFAFYGMTFIAPEKAKKKLYQLMIRSLGISIRLNAPAEEIRKHTDGCVVATNHVSILDTLISLDLPNATIMIGNPISQLNFFNRILYTAALNLSQVKQWHVLERRDLVKRIQEWRQNQSGTTLYTTPEMTIGNQRGLFKFNSAFMSFDLPVVPLATRIDTNIGLNVNPVNSSNFAIIARLLMAPRIIFNLHYLDREVKLPDESKDQFAQRVQQAIALQLKVPATNWTASDKHAYRKKLKAGSKAQES